MIQYVNLFSCFSHFIISLVSLLLLFLVITKDEFFFLDTKSFVKTSTILNITVSSEMAASTTFVTIITIPIIMIRTSAFVTIITTFKIKIRSSPAFITIATLITQMTVFTTNVTSTFIARMIKSTTTRTFIIKFIINFKNFFKL